MSERPSDLSRSSVLTVSLGLLGLQVSSGGQVAERTTVPDSRGAEAVLAESVVLVGRVVDADGTPVEGAVVVSSAGGRARSDARGQVRLEVRVPHGAESLQVSAIDRTSGARLAASAQVALPGSGGTHSGAFVLELGGACQPGWEPTFGGQPGTGALNFQGIGVNCLTTFDDGSGPALYVGGGFPTVGGVEASSVAKWDGSSWSKVGNGLGERVWALAGFDDGSGPALYAGVFHEVRKWNGSSWSVLGGANAFVYALAVFDDGSGPALYAGGSFTAVGGVAANRIAKWDGSTWSALGSGTSGSVLSLAVHDDGSGPALYVGGIFLNAGGVPANWIARWDGSSWSALGSGMNSLVGALAVFDDGSGPALHAGGLFTSAGGAGASHVAKWDGASWSALDSGTNDEVEALAAFDDGSGPALYAGGLFTSAGGASASHVAKWDGVSWSALDGGTLDGGTNDRVAALAAFDDGGGPILYVGGHFTTAGAVPASRFAMWDGATWSATSDGINKNIDAAIVFDDGAGPALYAAGGFTGAGGMAINRIGKWDDAGWSVLGTGLGFGNVNALAVFDDGGGPALHAAGSFATAGGAPANRIAKWDGAGWSTLGDGLDGSVLDLAVFDDGGGPELYACGLFTNAGGAPASRIARWDGASWSALGSGMTGGFGNATAVNALAVFDDGGGPALYAGGEFFNAGDVAATRIAKWRKGAWSPLIGPGSGVNGTLHALTVLDDGGGPALYAGGDFLRGGGVDLNRIGKWNGSSWSALGSGMSDRVDALAAFDDGSGPALYAGGEFLVAGGVVAPRIAKWSGSSWSALGGGIGASSGWSSQGSDVSTLVVFDDGCGPSLYVGGAFESVPDSEDSFLARWRGCLDSSPPTLSCPPTMLVRDDPFDPPGEIVEFQVVAADACHPAPPVVCVPPSGSTFPRGTTTVTCTATDAAGNQASCSFDVVVALPPRTRVR